MMKKTPSVYHLSRRQVAVAISFTVPLLVSAASAADYPIGINFSEGTTQDLGAAETAGAPGFEQANWNNRGRWGNPGVLNDSTGAETPVTIKWDATGTWRTNAVETLGGNHKLMKGYLDSNGAAITTPFAGVFGGNDDKPTILVTGLGAWMQAKGLKSYSVVIYCDSDANSGQRGTRVWLAAANPETSANGDPGLGPDLTNRVDILDNSNWGDNPTFVRVTGTSGNGNYAVFSTLQADAFYIRLDEGGAVPWRGPISGFQIIGTDVAAILDTDQDGLPDFWENNYGLNPADNGSTNPDNGAAGDPDGDGRTNLQEYNGGVNSTNPQNPDTDNDGLSDGEEFTSGTNPLNADSDGDGLPDGWEVDHQLNPLDNGSGNSDNGGDGDPDNDSLLNSDEFSRGTHPRNSDTDGDGYPDAAEDLLGSWLSVEYTGTSPVNPDTDGDGIPDGQENPELPYQAGVRSGTDPNLPDTDGDGTGDRWEYLLGSNPASADSNLNVLAVNNGSFELPDTAGTFKNEVPAGWTLANSTNLAEDIFVETSTAVGMTGGDGLQYGGLQEIGAYLYQDLGIPFAANTTYLVDLSAGYRTNFPTGIVEFGLRSSVATGTPLPGYPGWIDINGTLIASGNPDADNVAGRFRPASSLATIGGGRLGRAFSFSTGATPPAGNLAVYIRHVSGFRVMFDNVRVIAVPNSRDSDSDGLPDGWELANNLSPADNGSGSVINGPNGDPDGDGRTNLQEFVTGTDPRDADTDNDGLPDGVETNTGIYVSATSTGTNPLKADTDGDGLPDQQEILNQLDPNNPDTDGDGATDLEELNAGTDPRNPASHPGGTTAITVTSYSLSGGTFQLAVSNLAAGKTYRLARSSTMTGFTPVGNSVTGVATHTFTDAAPPVGKAFYRVEEVTAP